MLCGNSPNHAQDSVDKCEQMATKCNEFVSDLRQLGKLIQSVINIVRSMLCL